MTCLQKFTKLIFTKFTPTSAVNKLHVKIRGNKFHELQIFPRNSRNLLSSEKKRHTVFGQGFMRAAGMLAVLIRLQYPVINVNNI